MASGLGGTLPPTPCASPRPHHLCLHHRPCASDLRMRSCSLPCHREIVALLLGQSPSALGAFFSLYNRGSRRELVSGCQGGSRKSRRLRRQFTALVAPW